MLPNIPKEQLLLIGFGDIAQRLSKLAADDYDITGFKRSPIKETNVSIVLGDCNNKADCRRLFSKSKTNYNVIVITLTPSVIDEEGYRQAYLETSKHLLANLKHQKQPPRLVIFVSSTSVYGQKNGEWVNEESPTTPTSFSGKILLSTEALWNDSELSTCIVRLSGIYGPKRRRLIEQVQLGQGTRAEPALYSNRIHADDAARALFHLIEKQRTETIEPIYLATDSEPVPLHDVKVWLAEKMDYPKDHLKTQNTGRSFRGSKRCDNQRLLNSGFHLRYPTFREGYQSVLESTKC